MGLTDPAGLQRGMLFFQDWSAKNDNLGRTAVSSCWPGACIFTPIKLLARELQVASQEMPVSTSPLPGDYEALGSKGEISEHEYAAFISRPQQALTE
jgi:hypothetical protein